MPKLILTLLCSVLLKADFNALLVHANSNELFHFIYDSRPFYCQIAAVETLSMKYQKSTNEVCKQSIANYLMKNPKIPLAFQYVLHEELTYSIKPYKERCFVMLNAGVSWSEYLLEKGIAILSANIDAMFMQTAEYEKLLLAQKRAEYEKRGLWSDISVSSCVMQ